MTERHERFQNKLFQTELVPGKAGSGRLFDEHAVPSAPVDCLGMKFGSDVERRAYFLERLKAYLPELRERPDFPAAADNDILRLSDPPYYTACPNPFLSEIVERHGRRYDPDTPYHREPFAVDVSEGKTDPLYKAHSYHTKVPHRAIIPSILHYTKPGDIVLDGFCGSGMTGVAAHWCESPPPEYRAALEAEWSERGRPQPDWGTRYTILGDLSPAATFIAANYNIPFDVDAFSAAARQLLDDVQEEVGWMYQTLHTDGKTKGRINYTVWSEVFTCPECTGDVVFLDAALDSTTKRIRKELECPHCGILTTKEHMELQIETYFDPILRQTLPAPRRVPVLLLYSLDRKTYEKPPDANDIEVIRRIAQMELPIELPTDDLPDCQMTRVGRVRTTHTKYVRQMFLPRAAHALTAMWRRADAYAESRLRNVLLFFVEQAIWGMSLLARYAPTHYSQVNQYLSGVFYISSQIAEVTPWYILDGKLGRLDKAFRGYPLRHTAAISTGDCADMRLPNNSIDYVFTDPPFGENIYYADLNYLVESWHGVFTASQPEAIIDRAREKTITDYQRLMQSCFTEYWRVLKPGRWMTIVFHNSRNFVWNAIQEAMLAAGVSSLQTCAPPRATRQTTRLLSAGNEHCRQTRSRDLGVQTRPRS